MILSSILVKLVTVALLELGYKSMSCKHAGWVSAFHATVVNTLLKPVSLYDTHSVIPIEVTDIKRDKK
jgi:hypothetical protein